MMYCSWPLPRILLVCTTLVFVLFVATPTYTPTTLVCVLFRLLLCTTLVCVLFVATTMYSIRVYYFSMCTATTYTTPISIGVGGCRNFL